jgi:hypothetical protein
MDLLRDYSLIYQTATALPTAFSQKEINERSQADLGQIRLQTFDLI